MSERCFQLDSPEFNGDPHGVFARMRATAPVVPVEIFGGIPAWLITRYDLARQALADPRLAKGIEHWRGYAAGEVPLTGDVAVAARRNVLSTDPPEHTRLRSVLSSALTPRRVAALRPWIEQIVTDLLNMIAHNGSADLVTDFAMPLPLTVICELFGVPQEHRAHIRTWTETLFHGAEPDRMQQASEDIDNLLAEIISGRRARIGDDFTSALIQAYDDGRLTLSEMVAMLRAMLAGGNETTINLLGNAVAALLRHPAQLAELTARPSLWPATIDEVLRWDGSVQNAIWRFATSDLLYGGVTIPRGDAVIVGLASANRDEQCFSDAALFDIQRADQAHLSFGHGIHHCVGEPLARLEASIALPALFARLPGLQLAVGWDELRYRRSTISRGLISLPVTFTPTALSLP